MARSEKTPGNQLVHPFLVSFKIIRVGSGVNWRVGFIVLAPVTRRLELAIYQASSEGSPGRVEGLFLDQGLEVKSLVVLVRFCTWIA